MMVRLGHKVTLEDGAELVVENPPEDLDFKDWQEVDRTVTVLMGCVKRGKKKQLTPLAYQHKRGYVIHLFRMITRKNTLF